jgi:hypothetical protein
MLPYTRTDPAIEYILNAIKLIKVYEKDDILDGDQMQEILVLMETFQMLGNPPDELLVNDGPGLPVV